MRPDTICLTGERAQVPPEGRVRSMSCSQPGPQVAQQGNLGSDRTKKTAGIVRPISGLLLQLRGTDLPEAACSSLDTPVVLLKSHFNQPRPPTYLPAGIASPGFR